MRIVLALVAALALACAPVRAAATPALPTGVRPVSGPVLTRFDPPDVRWGPGHLGVDLAARAGETVVAAADGVVRFAEVLAGRGVIVVDHGQVRTTYEPVAASVRVGEVVGRGRPIGRLQAGHPSCAGTTCLHWGLRAGETYLDPMLLLGGTIRLLPASVERAEALDPRPVTVSQPVARASMALLMPASGPVTSPYGMRRHPLTGVWKLHDGTDIGAACGTPIRAAASGTVAALSFTGAYGNRVVIDHGVASPGRLTTAYAHAGGVVVSVGDRVAAGQVIGTVGRTGLTTGCHVHVQVWAGGRLVDPMTVIP
ncbi:MAG: peptidoglycan DD-metalloendopeptidase family protein [Propionibacteriaceae bacterium]